jgi:hypothetical protein
MTETLQAAVPPSSGATAKPRKSAGRLIAAILVFIIAALSTPFALVGNWGYQTISDATVYMETVTPLAESPAIQESISAAITDAIVKQVDTQALVSQVLGVVVKDEKLTSALAAPLAAGVNGLIADLVRRFVASDAFQKIWVSVNIAAQRGIMAILQGNKGGVVELVGDKLVLDVSEMLDAVKKEVVAAGFTLAEKVTIPETDRQVVLLESPALAQVRMIYSLSQPVLQWLPLLVGALFLLSIALAVRRWVAALLAGIVLVIWGTMMSSLLEYGRNIFIDQLAETVFAKSSEVFWTTFVAYLERGIQSLLILGVTLIIASWFASNYALPTRMRESVTRGLHQLGSSFSSGGFGKFINERAATLRWVLCSVVALIALSGDLLESGRVLLLVLLAFGLLTLVELFRGSNAHATS